MLSIAVRSRWSNNGPTTIHKWNHTLVAPNTQRQRPQSHKQAGTGSQTRSPVARHNTTIRVPSHNSIHAKIQRTEISSVEMQLVTSQKATKVTPTLTLHMVGQPNLVNWPLLTTTATPLIRASLHLSMNHATSVPLWDSENKPYRCPPNRTLAIQ